MKLTSSLKFFDGNLEIDFLNEPEHEFDKKATKHVVSIVV